MDKDKLMTIGRVDNILAEYFLSLPLQYLLILILINNVIVIVPFRSPLSHFIATCTYVFPIVLIKPANFSHGTTKTMEQLET